MAQRITAVLLALLIVLSMAGCGGRAVSDVSGAAESGVSASVSDPPEDESSSVLSADASSSQAVSSQRSSSSSSSAAVTSKVEASKAPTVADVGGKAEDVTVTAPPAPPTVTPGIGTEVEAVTSHTALSAASYYQYSTLSGPERTAYDRIAAAVVKAQNLVEVSDLGLTQERAGVVFQRYMADHPQHFWLSRSYTVVTLSGQSAVHSYWLSYTDGSAVDAYGAPQASRSTIAAQIGAFNTRIQTMLSGISPSLSQLEKVKAIHDAVTASVSYDTDAAGRASDLCRAYDAYGAAVQGRAVCEGYSKLFEYLCYCVGINANQVIGTGNGGAHMWNTVKIDGSWYQMDVTWDDPVGLDLPYYAYFNLTSAQMYRDHAADGVLAVPSCTATAAAFDAHYAVRAHAPAAPENAADIADRLAKTRDDYLILHVSGGVDPAYVQTYFWNADAPFRQYLQQKGYTYRLETAYSQVGDYIYIPVIR